MKLRAKLISCHRAFWMHTTANRRGSIGHIASTPSLRKIFNMHVNQRIRTKLLRHVLQFQSSLTTVGVLNGQLALAIAQQRHAVGNLFSAINYQEFLERKKFCFAHDLYPKTIALKPKRCRAVC